MSGGGPAKCLYSIPSLFASQTGVRKDSYVVKKILRGQGLIEYALVLILIAIVVIFVLTFIGSKVSENFSQIGSGLNH